MHIYLSVGSSFVETSNAYALGPEMHPSKFYYTFGYLFRWFDLKFLTLNVKVLVSIQNSHANLNRPESRNPSTVVYFMRELWIGKSIHWKRFQLNFTVTQTLWKSIAPFNRALKIVFHCKIFMPIKLGFKLLLNCNLWFNNKFWPSLFVSKFNRFVRCRNIFWQETSNNGKITLNTDRHITK